MEIAALIMSSVAFIMVTIVAFALMEMVHLRREAEPTAPPLRPQELDLPNGVLGSEIALHGLDISGVGAALLLFLSPKCLTCRTLTAHLRSGVPVGVQIVLTAGSRPMLWDWAHDSGLDTNTCIFDDDYQIVNSLGIEGTPVVIGLLDGRVAFAYGVPSAEALDELVRQQEIAESGTFERRE